MGNMEKTQLTIKALTRRDYEVLCFIVNAYERRSLCMTYIQTLWAKHLEDKRAHQAQEKLTAEANAETQRSHMANEALTNKQLDETIRHQVAQDTETMRHNRVSEDEIARHNQETESIMRLENAIKAQANQLTYAANHERTITQAETERLKNSTNEMLGLLRNRIDEGQLKVAEKQLNATFARIGQDNERIEQEWAHIDNETMKVKAEAFKDYATGVNQAVQSVSNTVKVAKDIIPAPALSGESPMMIDAT